jgi:heterodisulfide reductase subunit C
MKITGQTERSMDPSFAKEILGRSGEDVFVCYQCRKCASGCPNRMFMDSTPTELMRYVQLGMVDEAMKGNTIWYCLSCHTCSTRCPQEIDIAHVVDMVRILALEKKMKVNVNNARTFSRLWMRMLKYMGRVYEVGLSGLLNLLAGNPFRDMRLGIQMLKKGKLRLMPSITKPFAMMKMFSRAKRLKK